MEVMYRPSHADATYDFKYGIRAVAGGGRSSARETIGRVAAGAVAKKLLATIGGTEVLAYVNRVRDVVANVDHDTFTMEDIESNPVRCPDAEAADAMYQGAHGCWLHTSLHHLFCVCGLMVASPVDVAVVIHGGLVLVLPSSIHQRTQPLTKCACVASHAAAR